MSERHRQLRQQFKETGVPAGVYAIRNLRSGRVLVGASMNLNGAMNRHRFELSRGAHRNGALQRDWDEQGADAFSFEAVDTVKRRDDPDFDAEAELAGLLGLWKDELQGSGANGYNG